MPSNANYAGQLHPSVLSLYIGSTCSPDVSQVATGITLSTTQHNLGLIRVSPVIITGTNPQFGNSFSVAAAVVKVALNVQTAPVGATHSWVALFDLNGNCVAATADGGATQWSTGYQAFAWTSPVSLSPGSLYYIDVVNNAATTAPKLSGIATLTAEVNGALAAGNVTPHRWATNSGALGTAPPVPGTSTLSYASNAAATSGFFAGLL
jgi:hypothetical protein